jgi:hypothetical protein
VITVYITPYVVFLAYFLLGSSTGVNQPGHEADAKGKNGDAMWSLVKHSCTQLEFGRVGEYCQDV